MSYNITNTQLQHLIKAYEAKYLTMKTEIESKFQSIIETTMTDLSFCLSETVEHAQTEKEQSYLIDQLKEEVKSITIRFNDKAKHETILRNEIKQLNNDLLIERQKTRREAELLNENSKLIQELKKEREKAKLIPLNTIQSQNQYASQHHQTITPSPIMTKSTRGFYYPTTASSNNYTMKAQQKKMASTKKSHPLNTIGSFNLRTNNHHNHHDSMDRIVTNESRIVTTKKSLITAYNIKNKIDVSIFINAKKKNKNEDQKNQGNKETEKRKMNRTSDSIQRKIMMNDILNSSFMKDANENNRREGSINTTSMNNEDSRVRSISNDLLEEYDKDLSEEMELLKYEEETLLKIINES